MPWMPTEELNVTALLEAWNAGDERAFEKLVPLVYEEMRRSAHRYMARERAGHTLQTTALINEVYLRLTTYHGVRWQNRQHFLGVCANLMRRVLTDFARSRRFLKRGGDAERVPLNVEELAGLEPAEGLVSLDDSLRALESIDERKSRVVELRFFGGLSVQETADALQVSPETVMRDWKFAKSWLLREMSTQ
jgi:RNA polymerase sigma factor (TIGR02999 family)